MTLAGEIFSKSFEKKYGVKWQRVMQALASYNKTKKRFDVRLKLSGLENLGKAIISSFYSFFPTIKNKTYLKKGFEPFVFVGDLSKIARRVVREKKRKEKILPLIIEYAKNFSSFLVERLYELEPFIFLRGSASPRSKKIFWYYEVGKEVVYISDIDLEVILPALDKSLIKYIKEKAEDFSLKHKVPLNTHIKDFKRIENGLFRYGYPLHIPYKNKSLYM